MSYAPAPYGFSYVPAAPGAAVTATDGPGAPHPWKESSFSFHDVLDALNPLQHIPIVNTIYRWATGDVPGNIARVVGDGLYGGPIGLAAGMLSVAVKDDTGKDPGEMVMGLWQMMSLAHRRRHLLGIFYYRTVDARARRIAVAVEDAVQLASRKANRK